MNPENAFDGQFQLLDYFLLSIILSALVILLTSPPTHSTDQLIRSGSRRKAIRQKMTIKRRPKQNFENNILMALEEISPGETVQNRDTIRGHQGSKISRLQLQSQSTSGIKNRSSDLLFPVREQHSEDSIRADVMNADANPANDFVMVSASDCGFVIEDNHNGRRSNRRRR